MSSAWGTRVDPLVPEESRWHSSQCGPATTPDAIGDALVATLREAAREADDEFIASVVAFCGLQVAQQLVDYERESRLLAKLADTGRVVTVLLQAARTAAEVAPARDSGEEEKEMKEEEETEEEAQHVSRLTRWRRTLAEERARRMEEVYEPLLSDDVQLTQEMGDETQQLEILTLMRHDVEIYGAVLTERETDVIAELYTQLVRRSGLVVGAIPRWFATTTSLWTDSVKTEVEMGEGAFVSQVSIWKTLRHPNVLRFYGACHVGRAFVIHEAHTGTAIPTEGLLWNDLLGLAAGIGYIHGRGFAYQTLSMDTFVLLSSERKLVVSGMGLVRTGGDGLDGELHRAANVMSFGLALLDIFRRIRGDWGDQANEWYIANRQLPASKPDCLNDLEWELICSIWSIILADRPSMADIVRTMRNLVILEDELNPLKVEEEITTTAGWEWRTQAFDNANKTISEVLEGVDEVCKDDADNGVFYRSVSDRLVNIYQQLEEYRETVPVCLMGDFDVILNDFFFHLGIVLEPDSSSSDSSLSTDSSDPTLSNDIDEFHRDLDRLMNAAPDLLHTSRVHRWRQTPRQEETWQHREEIVAAWEEMNAHDFDGDVIDTREVSDRGQDALGAHFLEALRKKEQYTKNAVAINFLRRDVEKKLGTDTSEPRLLMRWAHTGYIVRVINRAIESAVGILELTSAKIEWFEAFEGERKQRISFYQELLADSGRITLEMGDNCQIREIYTVLLYSRDEYASELSASERNITLSLFEKLKQQLNGDIISLPSWFAMSESQWSFAERSVLSGDEASCVQQIEICQQLNHPNVCKFYGAYHVGCTPFVVLDETVAFNAKISFEDKDVWRLLLGYAYGLQYILSRGLAYTSLSLADFRVTWDGKPVLSGVGLLHQTIDHLDDTQRKQSAASNVLAFGLIAFQILALKHLSTKAVRDLSKDDSPKLQYVQELSKEWFRVMRERDWPPRLEIGAASDDIQADIVGISNEMAKDEWNLLCSLCKVTSVDRTDVAKFISQMNALVQAREAPVEKAPAKVLKDVNAVICPSSGLKLKGLLAEIEKELKEISAQFQDDNRRVVKRLLDIYYQLENSAEPLLATFVEDFVGLVQKYHIQVSRQLENSDFSASDVMMSSVALTVADRNESMHHLLDELIWNSGCLSSKSAAHQWQELSREQAGLRSQSVMDTVLEDEEADYDTAGGNHTRWLLPTDEVQLLKRIAHGAFGAAYWGKWLDTDVVVKKVLTNQHESRNCQQFRHEVELWFSLNHANVIKLYGACHENNKQPVFVCEQAIHGTLSSFLKDKPTEEIWGALYTAAQGLRHLHERGIVHGDLKGNNVLVCDNNFVKLADFGLSAIAKPVLTPVDKPGSIGAIRWRAPECIQGFMPTFASDIYSFGMCIIEVVTGKYPWGSIPDPSVVRHVVDEKLLPSGLEAFDRDEGRLVKRMCQYDPDDRIDIGAVVCLLYQLYSGTDALDRSAEQDAEYTEAVVLQRFMALRRREILSDQVGELPEWFIPFIQLERAHLIGNGDFASVLDVRWCDCIVSAKTLRRKHEKTQEHFRYQVNIWFALNHPNIAHIYGGCHVGTPFYIFEMATNGCLTDYLKKKQDQAQAWHCLLDVALGLQYLHSCGIIHGSLNGKVCLVFDNGKTKVGSFGVSEYARSKDSYDSDLGGAFRRKAPEVLDGGIPTFAADIYSFGMCVIEALSGTLPWGGAMSDAAIKYRVSRGELPPQPAEMNGQEWEFVKRMCRYDPNSRISIDAVVCYIMAVTNGTAAASSNAARLFAKLEAMHGDIKLTDDQIHAALLTDKQQVVVSRKKLPTDQEPVVEKSCANRGDLVRQAPILQKYVPAAAYALEEDEGGDGPPAENDMMEEKTPVDAKADLEPSTADVVAGTKQHVSTSSDHSSVPLFIQRLSSDDKTPQQKEEALLDLLRVCATNSNRVQVYKSNGIPVLTSLVREGETFLSQLYALHGLSWLTFSFSKLRESEFESLLGCVRAPTHTEMLSLLHELQSDDDEVKERAALQCSCMATGGAGDTLHRVGVLPLLVGLLENGTANQKLWATEALVTMASDSDENCVAITRGGVIPPLVGLLRSGTDMHKQEAAYALGNLSANNDENRANITREGAIPPLAEFVKSVPDAQYQWAVKGQRSPPTFSCFAGPPAQDLAMSLALSIVDFLRQIYELRNAIRRQRRVNRRTYLRMMEICVELQSFDGVHANATLARTTILSKFSVAVIQFLLYLQKYNEMHKVVRLFKFATMEEQRLKIVDEIDQLYRMLNLDTAVAVINGAAAASSNAARLFAKIEDMHGDIKLTHDQIHAALLADKQQVIVSRMKLPADQESVVEKSCANRGDLARQAPILQKYVPAAAYPLEDDEGGNGPPAENDMIEDKMPVDAKADLEPCTANVDAGTKQNVSACSDHSSVPLLIQRLSSDDKTSQQKEEALLDLLLTCVTNSNRVQVYKSLGIPVLSRLVCDGETFLSQLYALHGLSWFTFSFSKLRESEFESLLGCVRAPTHTEMLSLLHELQFGDDEVKEHAALQCSCMATGGAGDVLRRVGVLPLLVGLLENGTANQKLWATEALVTLTSDSDENCVAITRGGVIPPLVGLLRFGTDMHKQEAAHALGNLAANNDENRAKIAREGAIPPLVEFVKSAADAQNQWAVYALGSLALNNEENRVLIAQEGAIRPLIKILNVGTRAQKQWSAYTLGNLAHSDANREEITLEGAIAPLIELLRAGTAMQKQRAAFALGNLACGNNTMTDFDEAILPLVDLVRMGSDTQKEDAAYTLGNLAANNDAIRDKIGRQGGIAPLVKILKTGGGEQKQWAAFALRYLAYDNDLNRMAIVVEGGIESLAATMEEGTDEQKEEAAHALEHLMVKENDAAANTDRIMTPLMRYFQAEAISQNANVAATAALNTLGTMREGVIPPFRRLMKPDIDATRQAASQNLGPDTREDSKSVNKGHSVVENAW